jgi:hypothetical protein
MGAAFGIASEAAWSETLGTGGTVPSGAPSGSGGMLARGTGSPVAIGTAGAVTISGGSNVGRPVAGAGAKSGPHAPTSKPNASSTHRTEDALVPTISVRAS